MARGGRARFGRTLFTEPRYMPNLKKMAVSSYLGL